MSQSVIALLIIAFVAISFTIEKIPLVLTALIAMLAMAFSGILTYGEAFSGFSNTAPILILGVSIIGSAFMTTGLADRTGNLLYKYAGSSEKKFIIITCVFSAVLGLFLNAMIVVSIIMPIIDSTVLKSNGTIRRKMVYLPSAIIGMFAANLTSVSASANVTASGLLAGSSYGQGLSLLDPAALVIPGFIMCFVFILTFGYRFMNKVFDFEDVPIIATASSDKGSEYKPLQGGIFLVTILAVIVLLVTTKINMGAITLAAACVLILTKCIDVKFAFQNVNWQTVVMVAAALGLAKGIEVSGAGVLIGDFIIRICGPLADSPYVMCVMMLVFTTFISEFMSNNSAVVIAMPIALALATSLGVSLLPFAISVAVGSNFAVATPVCTPSITLTTSAGYRFKDYLKVGGLLNVIAVIGAAIVLKIMYF